MSDIFSKFPKKQNDSIGSIGVWDIPDDVERLVKIPVSQLTPEQISIIRNYNLQVIDAFDYILKGKESGNWEYEGEKGSNSWVVDTSFESDILSSIYPLIGSLTYPNFIQGVINWKSSKNIFTGTGKDTGKPTWKIELSGSTLRIYQGLLQGERTDYKIYTVNIKDKTIKSNNPVGYSKLAIANFTKEQKRLTQELFKKTFNLDAEVDILIKTEPLITKKKTTLEAFQSSFKKPVKVSPKTTKLDTSIKDIKEVLKVPKNTLKIDLEAARRKEIKEIRDSNLSQELKNKLISLLK